MTATAGHDREIVRALEETQTTSSDRVATTATLLTVLPIQWPEHADQGRCDRILLVADPQLIGYRHEAYGWIARWDSDRYLSTGYSYAKWRFRPDSMIFLGDLFDEGLDATDDQWHETYERFVGIYPIEPGENAIFIAGDNDIGGESELISESRRSQFYNYFRNNATNLKERYTISETYLFQGKNLKRITKATVSIANILLTHVPYLSNAYKYSDVGLNMDLILSAHDHTTGIFEYQRSQPKAVLFTKVSDVSPTYIKTIGPNEPLIELQTPTCSYRMGVYSMGYGALSICRLNDEFRSTQVQYSVLWLPSRFPQLFLYFFAIFFSISWIIYQKRCRSRREKEVLSHFSALSRRRLVHCEWSAFTAQCSALRIQ
uniref:Metallophos domain-containing protein n=1 Tax=Caenorhabditis japonica TaxID=281687 RepID=A0A8R1E282_CAEJA